MGFTWILRVIIDHIHHKKIYWTLSVIYVDFKRHHWSYPTQEHFLNILWIMMISFQSPPKLNYFQHKNIPWTIIIFLWSIIRAIAKSDNNGCMYVMLSTIMRMRILILIISIRSKKNNVGNVGHNCTDHKSIPTRRHHWLLLFESVHTIILALTIMINVFASSDKR